MCFNTLIRTTENEKIKLMGYNCRNALAPRHWFQFTDDTALATVVQEDSQTLLNVLKCKCFGIKKNEKQSTRFRPYLKNNNKMIPAVKLHDLLVYLGKEFCYNMLCEIAKCDLVKRFSDYLEKINIFFLHLKHKTTIFKKFVYSKHRRALTIYHLPETWIVQNLDN